MGMDSEEYDEPVDISDDLDRAEDAIAEQAAEDQEEDEFYDLDDAGFCPVCSLEQGKNVPIPKGETCDCGGYENPDVDHDVEMKRVAAKGKCYFCRPATPLRNGVCVHCGWRAND